MIKEQIKTLINVDFEIHWTEEEWIIIDKEYDYADQRTNYGGRMRIKIKKEEVKNERELITILKQELRKIEKEASIKELSKKRRELKKIEKEIKELEERLKDE